MYSSEAVLIFESSAEFASNMLTGVSGSSAEVCYRFQIGAENNVDVAWIQSTLHFRSS
jgi:hypothetical protein